MRTGDFNIDGYPDIFLTVKKQNKKTKQVSTESLILINTIGDVKLKKEEKKGFPKNPFVHESKDDNKMNTFVLNKILNKGANSNLIAGIDIDEDGKLDLFW
jgi:hypothetical protein